MPILAVFSGITIRMYFQQSEHNPPHVHAQYGGEVAEIAIRTGDVLDGRLPPKELEMVREWIYVNRAALLSMWETQQFRKLPPLT